MKRIYFLFILVISSILLVSAQSDQTLCESSDGKWINNTCICPNEYLEGVGCVLGYISPEEITFFHIIWLFPQILIFALLFIGTILLVIYIYFYGDKRNKQNRRQGDKAEILTN